jgi:phosphomannomutase
MVKQKFPLGASAGDSQSQRQPGDEDCRLWQRIAGRYPEARADYSDGLRLDWGDRWAHVRASNTEPIIRVIAEAPDAVAAEELARELGGCVLGPKPKNSP